MFVKQKVTATCLVLLGCLLCAGAMGQNTTQNLIENGDFRQGLKGWKVRFPEANEKKYARNHENVKVVEAPDRPGSFAVSLASYGKTAQSQGVKVVSKLYPVKRGVEYEFGADVRRDRTGTIIFVEGYRKDPEQKVNGHDYIAGYRRCYRATIHVHEKSTDWVHVSRKIRP
ncbi:MAG: hypothetical protein D6820_07590, partial [Lentisphaerae bacterium]